MSKNNTQTKKARIEVLRSGKFKPMVGEAVSFGADDMKGIVKAYDPDIAPAPVVVGHPKTDAPAFGWVSGFEYDGEEDRLFADIDEIEPSFAQAVQDGRYKKVSLSFFQPDALNNPVPGQWYPKHVGFLGGAAPAVSGLANAVFVGNEDESLTFIAEFGERGFEEAASLFRLLREFLIEKFGMEEADKALPVYKLEWLDNTEIEKDHQPSFSEPLSKGVVMNSEQQSVLKKREDEIAAREAAFAAKEKEIIKREAEACNNEHVAFAEKLVSEGRLIPGSKDKVVAFLNKLPAQSEVSFSEGEEAQSLSKALQDILQEQPVAIEFGSVAMGDDPDKFTVDFASDGNPVDREQVALNAKAHSLMSKNPELDYLSAVETVNQE